MKKYEVFKQYIWLVETIRKYKSISLEEINELWRETDMSGGVDFNRTTFFRHKEAIQDIFGLYIECDRRNGYRYYIANSHVLDEDSVQNWLLSTMSVSNLISESLSLQERIQIESIPSGRFLPSMIEAMKLSCKVEVSYRRFGTTETRTHTFAPYALKVYQRRWYVLACFDDRKDSHDQTKNNYFGIFAFDRMENVTILKEKFKISPNFNAQIFFRDCYGIVFDDGTKAERIILRAYGTETDYIRTLPLHSSQCELDSGDDYADFELRLKPTLDFTGKLLSRGEWLEVLEPQWLRDEVMDMHQKAMNRYKK